MKLAMIMNHNSYEGREFMSLFLKENIELDVLVIGEYPENVPYEDERCNNLWQPPKFDSLIHKFNNFKFSSLKSDEFINFLSEQKYDVAIQGGTGILKENVISKFNTGILNFHPGKLPDFQGCCAPEWQLLKIGKVYCTCHLIDSGIDTGPIYKIKELNVNKNSYAEMRSSVYPDIANFVIEVIKELKEQDLSSILFTPQGDDGCYYKVIDEDNLNKVKSMFPL